MSTVLIEIRRARAPDAGAVAEAHDEAWRTAYQGIIPGAELEKLINRRGPAWWDGAIHGFPHFFLRVRVQIRQRSNGHPPPATYLLRSDHLAEQFLETGFVGLRAIRRNRQFQSRSPVLSNASVAAIGAGAR